MKRKTVRKESRNKSFTFSDFAEYQLMYTIFGAIFLVILVIVVVFFGDYLALLFK